MVTLSAAQMRVVAKHTGDEEPTAAQARKAAEAADKLAASTNSAELAKDARILHQYATDAEREMAQRNAALDDAAKQIKAGGGKEPRAKTKAGAKPKPKRSRKARGGKSIGNVRPVKEAERVVSETVDIGGLTWRFVGITIVLVLAYMLISNSGRVAKGLGSAGDIVRAVIYPPKVFGAKGGAGKTQYAVRRGRAASMVNRRGAA